MKPEDIVEQVEQLVLPVVQAEGLDVYDVEFRREPVGWVLRVYLAGTGRAVSIDECARVSRQLNALLDVKNVIDTRYYLEVSSPGLTRSLKKPRHFMKSAGARVKLVLREPVGGSIFVEGVITEATDDTVAVGTDAGERRVPLESVKNAKLVLEDFSKEKAK